MKTEIDLQKAIADFRVVGTTNIGYEVRFKNGEFRVVKEKELSKLKIEHPNWMTDF